MWVNGKIILPKMKKQERCQEEGVQVRPGYQSHSVQQKLETRCSGSSAQKGWQSRPQQPGSCEHDAKVKGKPTTHTPVVAGQRPTLTPGTPGRTGDLTATGQVPNSAMVLPFNNLQSGLIRCECLEHAWIFSEKRVTEIQAILISNACTWNKGWPAQLQKWRLIFMGNDSSVPIDLLKSMSHRPDWAQ